MGDQQASYSGQALEGSSGGEAASLNNKMPTAHIADKASYRPMGKVYYKDFK